jgi:hypothetical protein
VFGREPKPINPNKTKRGAIWTTAGGLLHGETKNAKEVPMRSSILIIIWLSFVVPARTQPAGDSAIEACRSTGFIALKEQSPSIKELIFDSESIVVSKANTNVENVPVRTVILGEAYIGKKEKGKARRFVCLLGEKGKVLLTFFISEQ